jgi:hypothetical protein
VLADLPNDWFAKIKMLLWRIVDKTDGERCSDLTHRYFRPERRLRCQLNFSGSFAPISEEPPFATRGANAERSPVERSLFTSDAHILHAS